MAPQAEKELAFPSNSSDDGDMPEDPPSSSSNPYETYDRISQHGAAQSDSAQTGGGASQTSVSQSGAGQNGVGRTQALGGVTSFDEAVRLFAEAVRRSGEIEFDDYLPPTGDPVRLPVLLKLLDIDLTNRWENGKGILLEQYFEKFPEVRSDDPSLGPLILSEYRLRHRYGDRPTLAAYQTRFPAQFDELEAKISAPGFRASRPVRRATRERVGSVSIPASSSTSAAATRSSPSWAPAPSAKSGRPAAPAAASKSPSRSSSVRAPTKRSNANCRPRRRFAVSSIRSWP
jgi:hypothetical protein